VSIIEIEGVSKSFGDFTVFRDVTMSIPAGETTAIIGPSGTGKSVMLKLIVGLMRPDTGAIRCFGVDVTKARESELYAVRRRMGMLFQQGALFDSMTVGDNVAFPLVHHRPELTDAARMAMVEEALELVDLPGSAGRMTAELSGGQRKRVGLARAIVEKPELVLFDEPNSGLDPLTSEAIDQLIERMKEALGVTFVIISHDIVGTVRVSDHIAMLSGGALIAHAPTHDFVRSRDPRVRAFLGRNLVLPDPDDPTATPALPTVPQ
jgi:phospholipid/cholesterol/gamma-HCH transport system ATP-binding protein